MKKEINIVYHSKDLDGLCCGFLAKRHYRSGGYLIKMIPYDYYDPIPDIEGEIIMMDVSFPKEEMEKIKDRLIWIDHHKTAIEANDVNINGLRRVGDSASLLTWEYFQMKLNVPNLVFWIDQYDVWKKINDRQWEGVLRRQHHMRVILKDPSEEDNYSDWIRQLNHFSCDLSLCYDTILNINSVVSKRSFDLYFEGLLFNAANHQGNSESLKDSMKPEHDAVCLFYLDGKAGYWVVSLYGCGKDYDLSKIAVKHGGGGHAQACGFKLNNIEELIK